MHRTHIGRGSRSGFVCVHWLSGTHLETGRLTTGLRSVVTARGQSGIQSLYVAPRRLSHPLFVFAPSRWARLALRRFNRLDAEPRRPLLRIARHLRDFAQVERGPGLIVHDYPQLLAVAEDRGECIMVANVLLRKLRGVFGVLEDAAAVGWQQRIAACRTALCACAPPAASSSRKPSAPSSPALRRSSRSRQSSPAMS